MKNVSIYKSPPKRNRPTHVGPHVNVQVEGLTKEGDIGQTPNILRDTHGIPLWDTGFSILTAPPLSSGIKITVVQSEH